MTLEKRFSEFFGFTETGVGMLYQRYQKRNEQIGGYEGILGYL